MSLPDPTLYAIAMCDVISARAQSLVALCDRISRIPDIDHVKSEKMEIYSSEMKDIIDELQSKVDYFGDKIRFLG